MNSTVAVRDWALPVPRPVTPSTILAEELGEVRRLLQTAGVDPALLVRLSRACDLAAGLDPYLDECTTPESPELAGLARRTRETNWDAHPSSSGLEQEMLSGHVEGQLLKFLVHMASASRVLEIGMFTGYSALAMAEALPDDGVVVACEVDPGVARFARECFDASPAGHKITIEVAPAMQTLRNLAADARRQFDFVFIDADKPGYLDYVEFLIDSTLLSPRAVIAVDNTLLQGEPYSETVGMSANGAAIAKFNAALTYDSRVEQVVLPLRDGVTLIRRTPDPSR
jgi:caffeoyl-CoA O-methyltransferase